MSARPARLRAVSNLAWPADDDAEALALAAATGFEGVELAPAKLFGPVSRASLDDAKAYRRTCAAAGLSVCSLQSLFFGEEGIHLFRSAAERARLATLLDRSAALAEALGARTCVFGAPTLRDPGGMAAAEAWDLAVGFFASVAPAFASRGVTLAFEANPESYGCRFATRTDHALRLASAVGEPGIGLQADTGTMFINAEGDMEAGRGLFSAAHVHVSEPGLAPLGSSGADHGRLSSLAALSPYRGWVSAEMRATPEWRANLPKAFEILSAGYC